MFFLTEVECHAWLDRIALSVPALQGDDFILRCGFTEVVSFSMEKNDVAIIHHIDALTSKEGGSSRFGERIIYVTEVGIWPSSEDWYLYYCLRNANGDRRPLTEAPGHLFLSHEVAEFRSFLGVAIRSGWGMLVAGTMSKIVAMINHDGEALICSRGDILVGEYLSNNKVDFEKHQ